MPCHDPRDSSTYHSDKIDRFCKDVCDTRGRLESDNARLSERCKEMTDLLCKAGRARHSKTDIPVEVLKWWDEHMELDRTHGEPW